LAADWLWAAAEISGLWIARLPTSAHRAGDASLFIPSGRGYDWIEVTENHLR
jgi:hypothetical protein